MCNSESESESGEGATMAHTNDIVIIFVKIKVKLKKMRMKLAPFLNNHIYASANALMGSKTVFTLCKKWPFNGGLL